MLARFSISLTVILTGLTIISCTDESTAPNSPVEDAARDPSLAVAPNSWGTRANMPSDRFSPAIAVVTNSQGQTLLYAIGGTTGSRAPLGTVQAYNAATNSWTTRASLPVALHTTNGAGVINGKIYVSGGRNSNGRTVPYLFVYNPATNQWTRRKDLPFPGTAGVTGVYQNKLYVLNLCTGDEPRCPIQSGMAIYRYDPVTNVWTFLAPAPRSHYAGMGGFIGGKFYLTGGVDRLRTLSVFDPATNTWTTRTPMPAGRHSAAFALVGAKLYLAGGFEEDLVNNGWVFRSKSVVRYDPGTDRWTTLAPLPSVRDGLSGGRVVVNGSARFEVVGGARPGNNLQYTP